MTCTCHVGFFEPNPSFAIGDGDIETPIAAQIDRSHGVSNLKFDRKRCGYPVRVRGRARGLSEIPRIQEGDSNHSENVFEHAAPFFLPRMGYNRKEFQSQLSFTKLPDLLLKGECSMMPRDATYTFVTDSRNGLRGLFCSSWKPLILSEPEVHVQSESRLSGIARLVMCLLLAIFALSSVAIGRIEAYSITPSSMQTKIGLGGEDRAAMERRRTNKSQSSSRMTPNANGSQGTWTRALIADCGWEPCLPHDGRSRQEDPLDPCLRPLQWQSDLEKEVNREGGFPGKNHPKNTEATPTLGCDGTHLYGTFFHHAGIHMVAMDLDGNELWKREVGPFNPKMFEYGYAPSPLIYRSMIIVCAEYDGESFLVAVQAKTGKDVWRISRPSSISFSSPVVAHVAGKDQLLISGVNKVSSYDPMTGKSLWEVDGTTFATCGTMVWENDVVMASGGYPKKETIAVKADGSGTVLWRNDKKCYEQSMIVHRGHLYALTDDGIAFCWRISDGKEMWKKRLKGPVSASPVAG